jgi:thermostable 8-oxoguanine DNA glycosylase
MLGMTDFVLQFAPSEIVALAARYGYEQDDDAFKAGSNIVGGNYSRDNLKIIVHWKSPRKIAYIDDNTDVEIARALRFASDPRTSESSAIDVLDKLHGVGVPIASAILTTMFPEKYTIIDFRALESLGVVKAPTDSIRYYVSYLAKCRELARKHKVSLRTLDRALWQWSKQNSARETTCA